MTDGARHASRRRTGGRARLLIGTSVLLSVVLGGGVAVAQLRSESACPDGRTSLRVAASPDLAPAVAAVAGGLADEPSCLAVEIRPTAALDVVAQLTGGLIEPPDVWIPESSLWLSRGATERVIPSVSDAGSVASSPLVLALSGPTATRVTPHDEPPTIDDLVGDGASRGPVAVRISDQPLSPARVGTVLALMAAVQGRDDARAALTQMLRAAEVQTVDTEQLVTLTRSDPAAVPVPEQTVWAANGAGGTSQSPKVVAVYPGGSAFDYPFAVLSGDDRTRDAGDVLRAALVADAGQERLRAAGFRDLSGRGADALSAAGSGVDPEQPVDLTQLDAAATADAERTLELLRTDARLLAVMDVSGSMEAEVPEAGGATRLQLATRAAAEGLGLYPDGTDVGFWVFSTDLGAGSDHQQIVPITEVTGAADRRALASALGTVAAAPGNTGLYDTTLAAVRELRRQYAPDKINAVVLLSDGEDTDDESIGLDQLLQTLVAEDDPARPIPVITIAYGPDGGADVLARISEATGGASYTATDPRQIQQVFLDAVGQRVCRPDCAASPLG